MTAAQWLSAATQRLAHSGSQDPGPDAEWILQWATGKSRQQLIMDTDTPLPSPVLTRCEEALSRREMGEPVQYITGEAYFFGRRFLCDSRALIPRMDTELLCETARMHIPPGRRTLLEMCTGSGIVAVTMALERPLCAVTATDLSPDALSLAKENARLHSASVRFLQGDLFAPVQGQVFDAILVNPPYLTREEMHSIPRELCCEPAMALFGGEDGLDFYRRIAREAAAHIVPGGFLAVEIGATQAEAVCALVQGALPVSAMGVERDLQGLPRLVWVHVKQ